MSTFTSRAARNRSALAAALGVAALVFGACGGGSDDAPSATNATPTSATAAAAASVASVAIETFSFSPKMLQVKTGETVTWTNKDNILHTVTSGTREYDPGDSGRVTKTQKDGLFDIQLDGTGATGKFTFTKAGKFHYFCDRHPGMEADIEVS